MRGEATKRENQGAMSIKRVFLNRQYSLSLDKKRCNGCGVCATICPKNAIKETPSSVVEGHLERNPRVDFDIDSCILCGECAVLCPLNALVMEIDGSEISTIVKNEAFPILLKDIAITKEKCKPECKIQCQEECPTKAIKVFTKSSENGEILEIKDVKINEKLCNYCKRCELICPLDAIQVKKPFQGSINLNIDLCPEGCNACEDICPSKAIAMKTGKPNISLEFCIFCSACEKVCPTEALKINRDWILHTEVKAAAWLTALKKLTSVRTVSKELMIKSGRRKASRVRRK